MLSSISNVKRTSNSNFRPTPPPYHIDITYVADRSGSMSTMGDSVINSVIEFVDSQKESNHNNCSFHLCSFGFESHEIHFNNINDFNLNNQQLKEYLNPQGCTRLIDTAIEQLDKQNQRIESYLNSLPTNIRQLNPKISKIFALMTDGQDNMSQNKHFHLQQKVQEARNNGTTCIFLGANQDAITSGSRFGFSQDNSLTFSATPIGLQQAVRSVSYATQRSINGNDVSFTPLERSSSQPTTIPSLQFSRTIASIPPPQLLYNQH